jgi:hypothetical protein
LVGWTVYERIAARMRSHNPDRVVIDGNGRVGTIRNLQSADLARAIREGSPVVKAMNTLIELFGGAHGIEGP